MPEPIPELPEKAQDDEEAAQSCHEEPDDKPQYANEGVPIEALD